MMFNKKRGKKIMSNRFILLVLFSVLALSPFVLYAQKKNLKVIKKGINVGAQNQKSAYGGFVNIKDMEVMDLSEANTQPDYIDFLYTYGQKTGINIMTPSSTSMGNFGTTYKHASEKWAEKNRGTLIYLENNKKNRSLYRSIKTNKDLENAFEESLLNIKEIDGYKRTVHGPNTRISSLSMGDYFIFKSNSGRGYAIGRIVDSQSGYQGYIRIDLFATQHEK